MADAPRICDTRPLVLEVEAGVHFWCSCGLTSFPPFCDGSHKGTGLRPVRFACTEPTTIRWCQCKHTGTPPYCDGSHHQFLK